MATPVGLQIGATGQRSLDLNYDLTRTCFRPDNLFIPDVSRRIKRDGFHIHHILFYVEYVRTRRGKAHSEMGLQRWSAMKTLPRGRLSLNRLSIAEAKMPVNQRLTL
jgi:hypothetical protein